MSRFYCPSCGTWIRGVSNPAPGDRQPPTYTEVLLNGIWAVYRNGEIMTAAEIVEELRRVADAK